MDAPLIGAAQRVEHYEIGAYGTVCEFAKELGDTEQKSLLTQTLEEEKTKSSRNSRKRSIRRLPVRGGNPPRPERQGEAETCGLISGLKSASKQRFSL
jgi:hypothetical protein